MNYQLEITPFWLIWVKGEGAYTPGDLVLFKTNDGIDIGRIISFQLGETEPSVGEIIRLLHNEDQLKREELKEYEEYCLLELKNAINEFNLDMKVVYAHCQFDEDRIIFYFTAEKKIKFRKLHRCISQKLNKRIAIKQIGARDYVRYLGGLGPCGRKICCASFLKNLKSISLRMAREQKIYVAPSKLSGICGKLLCCLNFEENFYTDFQTADYIPESAREEDERVEEF